MSSNAVLSSRLARYSTVCAGLVPFAGASGAIVAQTGLNIVVDPGERVTVDFGPGWGEVFALEAVHQRVGTWQYTSYTYSGGLGDPHPGPPVRVFESSALVQFNPANTGGLQGSLRGLGGNVGIFYTSVGALTPSNGNFYPIASAYGTGHWLRKQAIRQSGPNSFQSTFTTGSFYFDPGIRDFFAFGMSRGSDAFVGYMDVELTPDRSIIIHGWAFNDTPGGGIRPGQIPGPGVGGLAALAMGAAGVRRQRLARAA